MVDVAQARRDKKLRAGQHAGPRRLGIEHRPGAEHQLIAELVGRLFQRADRARNGHRDLGRADPAAVQRADRLDRARRRWNTAPPGRFPLP